MVLEYSVLVEPIVAPFLTPLFFRFMQVHVICFPNSSLTQGPLGLTTGPLQGNCRIDSVKPPCCSLRLMS